MFKHKIVSPSMRQSFSDDWIKVITAADSETRVLELERQLLQLDVTTESTIPPQIISFLQMHISDQVKEIALIGLLLSHQNLLDLDLNTNIARLFTGIDEGQSAEIRIACSRKLENLTASSPKQILADLSDELLLMVPGNPQYHYRFLLLLDTRIEDLKPTFSAYHV